MTPQGFEQRKLLEAEGLQRLVTLYNVFLDEYASIRQEYGEHLDDDLMAMLNVIEYAIATALEAYVQPEGREEPVPGIVKQLDDVMDEISILQAGLKTKRGITDEETNDGTEDE